MTPNIQLSSCRLLPELKEDVMKEKMRVPFAVALAITGLVVLMYSALAPWGLGVLVGVALAVWGYSLIVNRPRRPRRRDVRTSFGARIDGDR